MEKNGGVKWKSEQETDTDGPHDKACVLVWKMAKRAFVKLFLPTCACSVRILHLGANPNVKGLVASTSIWPFCPLINASKTRWLTGHGLEPLDSASNWKLETD